MISVGQEWAGLLKLLLSQKGCHDGWVAESSMVGAARKARVGGVTH